MKKLTIAVKLIGLFLTVYALTSIPLYFSYYYAAGKLDFKFFFLIVLLPYFITIIISLFCVFNAGLVVRLIFKGEYSSGSENQSGNNYLLLKYSARLLCVYLFFIAASDLAYGVSYLLAVHNMVNDPGYLDPEGLGKVISALVEFIAAILIAKINWSDIGDSNLSQ